MKILAGLHRRWDPGITFFYWVVPNTPMNAAILDIRFGCEPISPAYSPQTASPFVIANAVEQYY